MKVLIVGLGSMGKRRARLIKGIYPDVQILGVDTTKERREEAETLGIKTFESIQQAAEEKPNCAFVCTAPLSHYAIITQLLQNDMHVFTELNLVADGYTEMMSLAKEKGKCLFLSSTMLYRGEIQYMQSQVKQFAKPLSYIYHIGQYLPDWHPWENYKNFFVGDARTNGCREIFGIEMPWLTETFGEVESVHAVKDKVTELEINYPDRFFVTLTHKSGAKGMLAVDIVCPKAVRNLEIFGESLHIFWEGNPKALYKYNPETKEKEQVDTYAKFEQDSRYSDNIVETAYTDEMLCFFDVIEGKKEPLYTFEKDLKVLAVLDEIEK